MKRLNEWMGERSYLETVVIYAVFWGVLTWIFHALTSGPELSITDLAIRAIAALAFGLIFAAISRRRIRKAGGTSLLLRIRDAVKSGTVPPDADAGEWLPALRSQERILDRSRWLSPLMCCLLVAVGVWLVVLSIGDVPSVIEGAVFAVAFAALGVFVPVVSRRRLRKVRSLITQLSA